MPEFLFPLSEYNRVYQVAHGVLKGVPDAKAEKACIFFAAFGGFVLNQKYKINARVVGGAFSLCIGEGDVAVFGRLEDGRLTSALDAFHMWLQTETHVIDAPSISNVSPSLTRIATTDGVVTVITLNSRCRCRN
jgi:hypothetical protein